MYQRPEDRARPSRRALRIGVVGGVALLLFAILGFRLWDLQVINGSHYLAQAKDNRTRSTKILAPRGEIQARNGEVLVDNRTSLALQVDTSKLPEDTAEKNAELKEIGALVHMKLPAVLKQIKDEQEVVAAGAPITVRRDVGYDLIYYIEEHPGKFPGVTVERVFVRNYPDEDEAAQVLGHVNEVDEEELEKGPYKGTEPGEVVGQEGLEFTYDKVLRGTPGVSRYQVNASGEPTPGGRLVSTPPQPGNTLKLAINPAMQKAGEAALAEYGLPGAFVSMNIHTGEVLGMGSYPTYDPSVWTNLSTKEYDYLKSEENGTPIFNRATESAYPTGSTYKIMTALAGLEDHYITGSTVVQDNGFIKIDGQKFENSEGEINGEITLVPALERSSDVFFYELGRRMNGTNDLQEWSSEMGIARPTGIDVPVGFTGLLPTKRRADELFEAGESERPWSVGQNVQLATGQGELQTDPLQMAIAYAALGNGGTIVTPHLGMEVQDPAGRVLKEIDPGPRRHVKINPQSRQMIMEGLHDVTIGPGGTATKAFEGFPIPVAGKTGTAERLGYANNQAWFISLAPYPNPNVVTVVTIEEGGFGAETAAPANRKILEAYFHKQLEKENKEASESETGKAGTEIGEVTTDGIETGEVEFSEGVEGEEVLGEEAFEEEQPVEEEEAPVEETEGTEAGGIG
jgi:penicillin-binding protein 2